MYLFDVSENTVTKIRDTNGERIGGLGLLNNELYYTLQFRMTLHKLNLDGTFTHTEVAGKVHLKFNHDTSLFVKLIHWRSAS